MATSTYPTMTGAVDNTSAANFIPEIWSDEVIAAYERTLKLAGLVKKMPFTGKKGDTIHIPTPTRGVANAKAEGTAVTLQNAVEGVTDVSINRHFEYTRLIEDITDVQALSSLRKFYTDDAGYALGKQVDDDLWTWATGLGDGTHTYTPGDTGANHEHSNAYYIDTSTGLTAYAVDTVVGGTDVFTDAGFRALIQKMDEADVPMDGRHFVIPPSLRNAIMGVDRYNSSDFVNNGRVASGLIGELYGINVYVSSNAPVIEAAGESAATTTDIEAAMLFHDDTFALVEQKGVRSQAQYKQEFLSWMYTSDRLYGAVALRPDSGFVLAVAQ